MIMQSQTQYFLIFPPADLTSIKCYSKGLYSRSFIFIIIIIIIIIIINTIIIIIIIIIMIILLINIIVITFTVIIIIIIIIITIIYGWLYVWLRMLAFSFRKASLKKSDWHCACID